MPDTFEFIENNLELLSKCKMRMVRYHDTLLWSFELPDKSTRTLSHQQFAYYIKLRIQYTNTSIRKLS
jgi:hypothetical protein